MSNLYFIEKMMNFTWCKSKLKIHSGPVCTNIKYEDENNKMPAKVKN